MKLYKIILFFTLVTFCFFGNVKAQGDEKGDLIAKITLAKNTLKPFLEIETVSDDKNKNTYKTGNDWLTKIETYVNGKNKPTSKQIEECKTSLTHVINIDKAQKDTKSVETVLTNVITSLDTWYAAQKAQQGQAGSSKKEKEPVLNGKTETTKATEEESPLEQVGKQIKGLEAKNASLDSTKKVSDSLVTAQQKELESLKKVAQTAKENPATSTPSDEINFQNIAISAIIFLLVGIILGALLFYLLFYKKQKNKLVVENKTLSDKIETINRNTNKTDSELREDLRETSELLKNEKNEKEKQKKYYEGQLTDLENQLKTANSNRNQANQAAAIMPVATSVVKTVSVPTVSSGKHFWAEALLTAGPRKDFGQSANEADFGLGEDTAGVIVKHQHCFFWVLDGTSDAEILKTQDSRKQEYFSSRLLAQNISWNIHIAIEECQNDGYNSASILERAIQLTYKDWQENFDKLNQEDQNYVLSLLNRKKMLQCSTTALFGILDINGRLDVCRIGDSKFIALPNHPQQGKATGRQYITIKQNSSGNPTLDFTSFEDTRSTTEVLYNVDSVLAMTDGVSNKMDAWLSKISNSNFSDGKVRKVLANFPQGTNDDKALCIIQIKG